MKKKLLVLILTALICAVFVTMSISIINKQSSINTENADDNNIENADENTDNADIENANESTAHNDEEEKIDVSSFKDPNDPSIDVLVRDDTFITQLDYIITNIDDFIGKRIKVDGILTTKKDNTFIVIRLYDMPHEDHSDEITVGINAKYNGTIPAEETWVTITGTIEKANIDSRIMPLVNVEKIESHTSYGQEKVYN